MSRSGYDECDDYEPWSMALYRGIVQNAIRGKRGQALLRDLAEAMDAMLDKQLIKNALVEGDKVCALAAVGKKRGIDLDRLGVSADNYPEENNCKLAKAFDIAAPLAAEVQYVNDEAYWGLRPETPTARWERVRKWVAENLRQS